MPQAATCVTKHSAFIVDRGGKRRISPIIDLSQVQWSRTRDGISEAMIRVEGDACDRQMPIIEATRSKRHELVIYRGADRVWEGPISRIATETWGAELHAKDVLWYLEGQPMTQDWDNRYQSIAGPTEVSTRLENIIEYELAHSRTQFYSEGIDGAEEAIVEFIALGGTAEAVLGGWNVTVPALEGTGIPTLPSINVLPFLDVRHYANEARTSARTMPYEMNVMDHLKSMARTSGIDFTTVGRKIIIWDVSRHLGILRTLTSADFFANVLVTEYGADHTQSAFVVGQEGLYGSALNVKNLAYYGAWTKMFTVYNEDATAQPTQGDLDSQADRNLSGRSPVPIEVRIPDSSSLILSDTLTINELVCGVQIPLRASFNAREISQMQKLDHLVVTETAETENVQVTLTPATRPDSDVEE
jgi:hypothetical protein